MSGYHRACLNMSKETHSTGVEISDLCYRLEESSTNEYKVILSSISLLWLVIYYFQCAGFKKVGILLFLVCKQHLIPALYIKGLKVL